MQPVSETGVSIIKSVAVVAAAMVGVWVVFISAYYAFEWEPPNSAGVGNTVFSTIVGVNWFARRAGRRMNKGERLLFATGVSALNAVVPAAYVVGSLFYLGLPVDIASADLLLGGGKGYISETFVVWALVIGVTLAFTQAYILAWCLPRKFSSSRNAAAF